MVKKKDLCVVHIGMPKTGSSTLQRALFDNNGDTFCYPNLGEVHQTGALCGLFHLDPEHYYYFNHKNMSLNEIQSRKKQIMKSLHNQIVHSSKEVFIFSSEDLFHLPLSGIEELYNFFQIYFEKIQIIAYVRLPKSFMESAFQQLVKYHNQGAFNFDIIYHKYTNFERYDKIFGKENVKLWKFEPNKFPEGDILLDFCNRLHLKPSRAKVKVVNESLSMEVISILFTYHFHKNVKSDFGSKLHIINNNLVEKIRKIGDTKFKFSNKLIQNVINTYSDDYEWIISRIGEDFRDNLNTDNDTGISTENELMWFAIEFIDILADMVGLENINFKLEKHPQTVAKLVNLLMIKINRAL